MLEHADLLAILPHRHPILLVDRVLRCEPGSTVETVKAVTGAEPCYAGVTGPVTAFHYPQALLLESLAQSAGVLWSSTLGRGWRGTLALAEVRGARFGVPVLPGDVVHHTATVRSASGAISILAGRSETGSGTALTVDRLVLATLPAAHDR